MRWGLTLETASGLEDASGFVVIVARGVAKDGFNPGIGERMDQEEKSLLAIASDLTSGVAWSVAVGMFGRKVVRAQPN